MKYIAYIGIFLMVLSCGHSKSYTEQDQRAFENLKEMVTAKSFFITSTNARPMASNVLMQLGSAGILGPGNTGSSIDISSSTNELTVKGDSVTGYFPYFGEQNFGGGSYGTTHQGIEFEGVPKDYEVKFDEKKHRAEIRFGINDTYRGNESYNVFITLFPNLRSSVQIQSSNRTAIEFTGTVKRLKEDMMVEM